MVSTRFLTIDKYGGSAPDALNGVMSGVIVANTVGPNVNVFRQRVR